MKSKEENVLELFFNYPTREWHFEEIVRQAKLTRSKVDHWLKQFIKKGLIKRVKERKKMPHYTGNFDSAPYRNRKKLFAMQQLYESGFLDHLASLNSKAVVIFGSFARSDWYDASDIDVFLYGDTQGLRIANYEVKLGREIELFICNNSDELSKFSNGFLKNVVKGTVIKGELDFIGVEYA